jgi:hypothetical protein
MAPGRHPPSCCAPPVRARLAGEAGLNIERPLRPKVSDEALCPLHSPHIVWLVAGCKGSASCANRCCSHQARNAGWEVPLPPSPLRTARNPRTRRLLPPPLRLRIQRLWGVGEWSPSDRPALRTALRNGGSGESWALEGRGLLSRGTRLALVVPRRTRTTRVFLYRHWKVLQSGRRRTVAAACVPCRLLCCLCATLCCCMWWCCLCCAVLCCVVMCCALQRMYCYVPWSDCDTQDNTTQHMIRVCAMIAGSMQLCLYVSLLTTC